MTEYYLQNVVILFIIICLLKGFLNFIIWMLNKYILPVRMYLNDITSYSMADLKKTHAVLYRQILIKNLYTMRTTVKWAIIILAMCICLCLGFIVFKNSDYFQRYFDAKQQKLELATEERVDEMLKLIGDQQIYMDSIRVVTTTQIDSLSGIINSLKTENIKLQERNRNHTYMIDNLNKIISTHGMQTKK